MKNTNNTLLHTLQKKVAKRQLVNRLMLKNIKGGAANGCPPPFGNDMPPPPPTSGS